MRSLIFLFVCCGMVAISAFSSRLFAKRVAALSLNPPNQPTDVNCEPKLAKVPAGLVFCSVMNQRQRFFIPSTNNFFGGIKVSKVLCGSGCASLLLPIDSREEMENIFSTHGSSCSFSIRRAKGVGGKSMVCLVVRTRGLQKLKIGIGRDMFGGGGNNPIESEFLRFALCSEDIATIVSAHRERFSEEEVKLLEEEAKDHKRRTHALLGQKVLQGLSLIKHRNCELYVDASIYQLPSDFMELEAQIKTLLAGLTDHFPEDFSDWEDDDFVFDDDEIINEEEM